VSRSEPSPTWLPRLTLFLAEGGNEVGNCMEACRSRERAAAFVADDTLRRRRYGQRAAVAGKRERGFWVLVTSKFGHGQEALEHQSQGGIRPSLLAKPQRLESELSAVCESL
jgi:hypothetical protein